MNIIINKNNINAFVKSHNYDGLDALAHQKLSSCIDAIITNIYNNLCTILKAYPAKRITKKQFAIILHVMQNPKCNMGGGGSCGGKISSSGGGSCESKNKSSGGGCGRSIRGGSGQAGRTVLPMEYFNPEYNGNYSTAHANIDTNMPMTVSRAALSYYAPVIDSMSTTDALVGGGSSLISPDEIKAFLKRKNSKFTLSQDAINIIVTIVKDNIEKLLDDCKNPKVKKLTGKKIYSVLKKKPEQYIHLSCVSSCKV
jgi:hypothetical protein